MQHNATNAFARSSEYPRTASLYPHKSHPTRCNTLQHAATRCSMLQHGAARCSILQHAATHCSTLQHMYSLDHWNIHERPPSRIPIQHPATRCSTLQHTATRRNTLQHAAAHCNTCIFSIIGISTNGLPLESPSSTLQHAAAHCNTPQHTAKH